MPSGQKTSAKRDIIRLPQSEVRPGVPHVRMLENPAEFEVAPVRSYRARWHLFLPTIAIGVMYSLAWVYQYSQGLQNSAIGRLLLIVVAVGVPLLAAHAFLRYQTIRVQVMSKGVRYHSGWPKDLPVDLPYDLVERVRIKRNLTSFVFNTGTLVIDLTTGERVAIADLYKPQDVKSAIESAIGNLAEE